ncbi:MAG TPA: hypothetical protein VML75_25325 [Kofleriaceae bacterium]|nr:hypothetical protein [Kofleriaceae bacterium]
MKTTVLEGPDGRLYEIPDDQLASFAVPGSKVAELRGRMAARAGGPGAAPNGGGSDHPAPADHARLGELPPGHPGYAQQQTMLAANAIASAVPAGTGVTLNFYFGGGAAPSLSMGVGATAAASDSGVEGYHMTFDESGIPVQHTDMMWGDYIDKQGNPAVGFHSHDPISGNAQ